MNKLIESIELAKELYKYAVMNENNFIEDKSLNLITNLTLLKDMDSIENSPKKSFKENIKNEIDRVERKVPKWFSKPEQYNSRILLAYMKLSNLNKLPVNFNTLMEFTKIEEKVFLGHYNNMKIISAKNHAKVFEEENKTITLWQPISAFVSASYREDVFRIWAKRKGGMSQENVIESYIKTLKNKIPKHLEDHNSEFQYENIFLCTDIKVLGQLREKYLKDGEWEDTNSTYPSSIKKYIEFLENN